METTQAAAGDVYCGECPSRLILDRIADKWTAMIVGKLAVEPMRFNQLKRAMVGVTPKVLTQTLRNLERDGIVDRTVFPTVPTTVVYSLTTLGDSLVEPLAVIRSWSESHRDHVLAARRDYDTRDADAAAAMVASTAR